MKLFKSSATALVAGLVFAAAAPVQAAIVVSEAAPYASGNTAYGADWFELTNTGAAAVDITGWKVDDDSNSFGSAIALHGVTSIAAGQSVVFIEGKANGSTDAALDASFRSAWFGANAPAGLVIGNYGGSGIGLGTGGDALHIFNASGTAVANVTFGNSTTGRSFDNAAGANGSISNLSTIGVNGAFKSFDGAEIGSPGLIAAAVPEPETYAMMIAGLAGLAFMRRRARR